MNIDIEKLIQYAINNGVNDRHSAESIVHDAILKFQEEAPELIKSRIFYDTKEYRRNMFKQRARQYDDPIEEIHSRIVDREDHEDHTNDIGINPYVELENRLNQRQLINDLLSNSDELTTAIVRTWLSTDKPTLSSVGRILGINHNTVSRKLKRLASNFNVDNHGNLLDYFSA